VRFDDVCRAPEPQLRRLLELAGMTVETDQLARLAAGVRPPKSLGRWRAHGTAAFTAAQIEAVESFGFDVR
jgi:hypothetical protein